MRFITMLLGLALIALAGLWFFTPVLDSTYARHAPGIAQSHNRSAAPAAAPGGASRGPASAPSANSGSAAMQIGSKALADNFMSMINLGTGILGAWFTFMSYRLQARGRRDRD